MSDIDQLEAAARDFESNADLDFESNADLDFVDPKRLAAVVDRLQGNLCAVEEKLERRQLFISESSGMFKVDGWLDPEGGAALKTAIDALAKPLGADDRRSPRQRRTP
jgi:hypothetical protein